MDSIVDLQRRLRALPRELNGLYWSLLESIQPPFYLAQASRLLQIVYHAESSLYFVQLSLADDDTCENFITTSQMPFRSMLDLSAGVTRTIYRVRSRCAGLLEAHGTRTWKMPMLAGDSILFEIQQGDVQHNVPKVQFLHLTVKEFLEDATVWTRLLSKTIDTGFDPHVCLARSQIVT